MHEKRLDSDIINVFPAPVGWRAIYFASGDFGDGEPQELPVVAFATEKLTMERVWSEDEYPSVPPNAIQGINEEGKVYIVRATSTRLVAMVADIESWGLPYSAELSPADATDHFVGLATPDSKIQEWTDTCAESYKAWLKNEARASTPTGSLNPRPYLLVTHRLRRLAENVKVPVDVANAARTVLGFLDADEESSSTP